MKLFSWLANETLEQTPLFSADGVWRKGESDALHNKLKAKKEDIADVQSMEKEMAEALKESRTDIDALKTEIYTDIKTANEWFFSTDYASASAT